LYFYYLLIIEAKTFRDEIKSLIYKVKGVRMSNNSNNIADRCRLFAEGIIDFSIYKFKNFFSYDTNKLIALLFAMFFIKYLIAPDLGINQELFSYSYNSIDIVGLLLSTVSHGNYPHLITNIIILYIIGHSIEGYLDDRELLYIFFASSISIAVLTKITYLYVGSSAVNSSVGASGGISAFIGISILLYFDRSKHSEYDILTLITDIPSAISEQFNLTYDYGKIIYKIIIIYIGFKLIKLSLISLYSTGLNTTTLHISHFMGVIIGLIYVSINMKNIFNK
jgi:membrane associated rhomboid family serine protease